MNKAMMIHNKSQTSIEFMIFVGLAFMLVFFITLHQLSGTRQVYVEKESSLVYDLAMGLQEEIRMASVSEEGYARNFSIPSRLENFDFELSMAQEFLTVTGNNTFYSVRIPNATGTLVKGSNIIMNKGGALYLNP
ncbi:hypothetical protein HYX09_00755 [Candidatus Woesearchaeota archaeon]|nr:hypothetical protein [Candidatus Woesearchaeota archaeon]